MTEQMTPEEITNGLVHCMEQMTKFAQPILDHRDGVRAAAMDPDARKNLETAAAIFAKWAPVLRNTSRIVQKADDILMRTLRSTRGKVRA